MTNEAWQVVLILFIAIGVVSAQTDTLIPYPLEEVVLTGSKTWRQQPVSAATDTMGLLETHQPGLRGALLRQPGVLAFSGENFAQDLRISVRGFGSRSAFGIRGIRVWMDGIPLTSPDGTTQLDEISVWDIAAVTYVTSGLSARYGNAAGGGLLLSGPGASSPSLLRCSVSPYGAWNAGLRLNYGTKLNRHSTSVNHHYFKGRRAWADSRNTTLYHKSNVWLTPDWQLVAIAGMFYSPLGQDPGALTRTEFDSDPFQASARNRLYQAGESVHGGMVGLQSQYYISSRVTLLTSLYYRKRLFEARLPFVTSGWVTFDRDLGGIHNTIEIRISDTWNVSAGVNGDAQRDRRRLYRNGEGVKGPLTADQNERLINGGLWVQSDWTRGRFHMYQVLRRDIHRFSMEDLFLSDGDQQGRRAFGRYNAATGVQYTLAKDVQAYSSVSTGFETPTLNELANNPSGAGGWNTEVTPESSWQIEAGVRSRTATTLQWSAVGFRAALKDLITGYELPATPGRTYYRNASRAVRWGAEMWMSYRPSDAWGIEGSYTWSQFTYEDYVWQGTTFTGNRQPLIPVHRGTIRLHMPVSRYFDVSCQWAVQSSIFADDANTVSVPAVIECNAGIATSPSLLRQVRFGINGSNVLGTAPWSNIRANAAAMRYFEAATPVFLSIFAEWTPVRSAGK